MKYIIVFFKYVLYNECVPIWMQKLTMFPSKFEPGNTRELLAPINSDANSLALNINKLYSNVSEGTQTHTGDDWLLTGVQMRLF